VIAVNAAPRVHQTLLSFVVRENIATPAMVFAGNSPRSRSAQVTAEQRSLTSNKRLLHTALQSAALLLAR